MYDKLVFYLHYGNGDIFESREFAKEYMQKITAKEYWYAHSKPNYILENIENLQQTEILDFMDMRKAWFVKDNCLYINMWIGRDSQYVLPGIGCVVEELYRMHNDILSSLNLPTLEKDIYEYIPATVLDIPTWLPQEIIMNENWGWNLILLCNGPVQSNQAVNFDFDPIIQKLINDFNHILIYVTSGTKVDSSRVIDKSHYNLNQIATLSSATKTIIGRNSGPHVFAQNLDNWNDPTKACLSFTYKEEASHFVLSNHLPMKKYWSPATGTQDVYNKIVEVINRNG